MKSINIPKDILDKIKDTEKFEFSIDEIISTIENDEDCEYNFCYNFNKIERLERDIEDFNIYMLLGTLKDVKERLNDPKLKDYFEIRFCYDSDGDDIDICLVDPRPETDDEYTDRLIKVFHDVDKYLSIKHEKFGDLINEKEKLLKRLNEINKILKID